MLEFDDALKCIMTFAAETTNEKVKIQNSLGRYLANPVLGKIDLPPFSKSAMDGFAIRANDRSIEFRIEETIAAGVVPAKSVGEGQCSRIMTGAMIPPGADMVVKVENTTVTEAETMRIHARENGRNIIQKSENKISCIYRDFFKISMNILFDKISKRTRSYYHPQRI